MKIFLLCDFFGALEHREIGSISSVVETTLKECARVLLVHGLAGRRSLLFGDPCVDQLIVEGVRGLLVVPSGS